LPVALLYLERGAALRHRHEQGELRVEHLSAHHLIPLASHSSSIHALLPGEHHAAQEERGRETKRERVKARE
jgi:hypothetical protein